MRSEGMQVIEDGEQTIPLSSYVTTHGLALTRFAYLVCGNRSQAEDLVQEVYLSIYRRFGSQLPAGLPIAYARTALVRAQLSLTRHRWFQAERSSDQLPEAPAADPDPAESDQLWKLLDRLSHRQRCVLVLRYRYGCADAEIAETLGCRPATVRSLAARALTELRANTSIAELGRNL
ncbi:MAG: SigE family RNA polymerase sigma factor [Jatrophihabitantaceae bacterium]